MLSPWRPELAAPAVAALGPAGLDPTSAQRQHSLTGQPAEMLCWPPHAAALQPGHHVALGIWLPAGEIAKRNRVRTSSADGIVC